MNSLVAPLEAVLFASGEPLSNQQLMEILGLENQEQLEEIAKELSQRMEENNSGLVLQRIANGYQLVTKTELFSYVEKLSQVRDKKLSTASMETLSIVAFKQPITKQEIEAIRGVRVDKTIAKLLELELIKELGRKLVIGRPILYGTTDTFLKCFGLNALTDLPSLPDIDMSELDALLEANAVEDNQNSIEENKE